MGYTPLDEDVIYSTVFERGPMVFAVWCAILATSDANGVSALNQRTLFKLWDGKVAMHHIDEAWHVLSGPDLESKNKDHGGRRIIDYGDGRWFVVSHQKYREKHRAEVRKHQLAEAKRRQRARDAGEMCAECDSPPDPGSEKNKDGRLFCAVHSNHQNGEPT